METGERTPKPTKEKRDSNLRSHTSAIKRETKETSLLDQENPFSPQWWTRETELKKGLTIDVETCSTEKANKGRGTWEPNLFDTKCHTAFHHREKKK